MSTKKVFDCFIFFNEIDVLKMRLAELYEHVDYFVLCEATSTFQGAAKPLFFQNHKAQFEQYLNKIVHVVVDDMPQIDDAPNDGKSMEHSQSAWNREHFQRGALRRGIAQAKPDDVIIITDCDEIPSQETIRYLRKESGYFILDMAMYQFYLNMCAIPSGWRKPFAYTFALDSVVGDYSYIRTHEIESFEKFSESNHYVADAGWHFTFLGGEENVRSKLKAYSHTDGWQRRMWDEETLREQMIALREVGGSKILRFRRIDKSFPYVVQGNVASYISAGLAKDESIRLMELEELFASKDSRNQITVEVHNQAVKVLGALRRAASAQLSHNPSLVNIIPGSKDFSMGWSSGVQSQCARIENSVPPPHEGNLVMRHQRDALDLTTDTNVGYFSYLAVEQSHQYTASCFIWLPSEFSGSIVELSLETGKQSKVAAKLTLREKWQRISATATSSPFTNGCNVVLRVHGTKPSALYSSCWQLEDGATPTEYRGTDIKF